MGGVAGPLVVVELVKKPKYAEIVNVRLGDGSTRRGQVRTRELHIILQPESHFTPHLTLTPFFSHKIH